MVTLKIIRSDGETGYRVGFIQITLSQDIYAFKSRHFKLSIDIFLISVCHVFAEFQFILVTRF